MKSRFFLLTGLTALLLSCGQASRRHAEKDSARAVKGSTDYIPSATRKFVTNAAEGSLKGIGLARLAAEKARDPRIKQYGVRVVTDHMAAKQELQRVADKLGITMPLEVDKKDGEDIKGLAAKPPLDFDKAFIKQVISDQKKTVNRFNRASDSNDTLVSAFAANMLPKLNGHLSEANHILENMRKEINNSDLDRQ
jgi:putative membrane protein